MRKDPFARASWPLCAAAALALFTPPAIAQDTAPAPADTETAAVQGGTVGPVDAATSAGADKPALWSATASAGISNRDDGPNGSWQSLSLSRTVGRGYVRGGLMRYHGTLTQADVALPSDYYVATLGAGGNFDNWVVDGWISYGRQDYGRIRTSQGSRASTGAKGSDYYAIGGDFGRVVPLGGKFFLTPTVAASFAEGKLLRPAPTDALAEANVRDLETDEPTWSANAAMRIDRAFGNEGQHYIGLSISRNWTSNGLSQLWLRPGYDADTGLPFRLDSKHYADGWFEAGATANMRLGKRLYLDLFATRGFGLKAGDTTSAGVTLRRSF